MTRMTWNDPEKRFFDTGLDRGVLYSKKTPPPGHIIAVNRVENPAAIIDVSGGNGNDSYESLEGDSGAVRLGMQSGRTYTIMATINTPSAQTGTLHEYARSLVVFTRVGSDPVVAHPSVAGPLVGTDRVRVTFDLPEDTTEAYIRIYNGSAVSSEVVHWTKFALFEGPTAIPYFDGDTPDSELYSYEWQGAPNDSPSFKRDIPALAVPWDGLTGVDENGAESSVVYYMDGRPYLIMPKPKEYQATIKAYTYPDEFSALMGLVEVADGMYLDSQMGDMFDLSYRTLVGNGLEGADHGYKIHLVYNATVAPQSLSYATQDNAVNPMEFSWDIQASPVPVEGHRPMAHIVIDTRHMDSIKLAQIEAILYGDDSRRPSMPRPGDILDLLSYGDTMVIIDHGDGTWEVRGSYTNIQVDDDGNFEISGLYSAMRPDGSYLISTEPITSESMGITATIEEPMNW